jgi:hypothetical protein
VIGPDSKAVLSERCTAAKFRNERKMEMQPKQTWDPSKAVYWMVWALQKQGFSGTAEFELEFAGGNLLVITETVKASVIYRDSQVGHEPDRPQ